MTRISRSASLSLAAALCATLSAVAQAAPIQPVTSFTLANSYPSLGVLPAWGTAPTNYSDVAFNYDSNTLFVIDNGNQDVYEYSTTGTPLRRIAGSGQLDTEGIAYMGSNKFAIIEEGVKDISVVTIGPATTSFTKAGASQIIVPSAPAGNLGNTGFEGVTYNSALNQFYVVKEKSSRQVYQVANNGTATLLTAVTSSVTGTGVTDLSGIFFDNSPGGHLFILSDEGNKVIEVGLDGTLYGTLDIPGFQPEGITFSPDGLNMYIIGESRELYHFTSVPEPASLALGAIAMVGLVGAYRRRRRVCAR
jgi:uncharacterized protein YjiK